jgi:hypothetical protein
MPCRKCGGVIVYDRCSRCGPQQRVAPRPILAVRSKAGTLFRSGDVGECYEDIIARRPEVAGGELGFAEIRERLDRSPEMVFVPIASAPEPGAQLSLF